MRLTQRKNRLRTGSIFKTTLVGMCLFFFSSLAFAQSAVVRGIVYDDLNLPAMGVNILKKGTA